MAPAFSRTKDGAAEATAAFGAFAPRGPVAALIAGARGCGPGWAGTRRAFALRKLALRMVGPAALDVETFGAKMRLKGALSACEKRLLYTPQYVDPTERAILARRLPQGGVFVDIGANVGGYSLFVAMQRPDARIVAIEPQADICARLAFHARVNAAAGMRAVECALADREGCAELFLDPRDRSRASIRMLGGDGAQERRRVAVTTLAALCRHERIDRIDALKVDAGGADDLVLETFFVQAPQRLAPALLIIDATAPASAGLAARLAGSGYREIARTRAKHVFERRED